MSLKYWLPVCCTTAFPLTAMVGETAALSNRLLKRFSNKRGGHSGVSLVEAVISIGVLALVIPIVSGALAQAGKCMVVTRAESRSTWMIPACLDEIDASRAARSPYFPATAAGQTFPSAGDVWALAFSPEGKTIGKISRSLYDTGTRTLDGHPVRYLAAMTATMAPSCGAPTSMLQVRVSLEYPARLPAAHRQKLDFYTLIP